MPSIEQTVVITGASGRIGREVVPLLRRPGRMLRLVDTSPTELEPGDDISWHDVSIEDADGMEEVLDGASGLVHLAGLSSERPWADLLRVNIDGTHTVLEAARRTGVDRVLLASSIHAVGFQPVAAARATMPPLPRPDTYYGVSKAAMEALGSLYADRFGMSVVSARICAFTGNAGDGRTTAQWLSPGDMARLIEAGSRARRRCAPHRVGRLGQCTRVVLARRRIRDRLPPAGRRPSGGDRARRGGAARARHPGAARGRVHG